jgi:hypothetical protein
MDLLLFWPEKAFSENSLRLPKKKEFFKSTFCVALLLKATGKIR